MAQTAAKALNGVAKVAGVIAAGGYIGQECLYTGTYYT